MAQGESASTARSDGGSVRAKDGIRWPSLSISPHGPRPMPSPHVRAATPSRRLEEGSAMNRIETVRYTAKTHTSGGRDGASRSTDSRLDVKLSPSGAPGTGTNAEQLFAARARSRIGKRSLIARWPKTSRCRVAARPNKLSATPSTKAERTGSLPLEGNAGEPPAWRRRSDWSPRARPRAGRFDPRRRGP